MPPKENKQLAAWKQAFDDVIDHYHSLKSSTGGVKGIDYSKVGGGNTDNLLIVNPSDFICDVELAAGKALLVCCPRDTC
jgi:hypothetical protein